MTAPLKGVNLIGNGPDVLRRVVMLGNDVEVSDGIRTCGKDGQSVPVGVGCPTVKISAITVGGTSRWADRVATSRACARVQSRTVDVSFSTLTRAHDMQGGPRWANPVICSCRWPPSAGRRCRGSRCNASAARVRSANPRLAGRFRRHRRANTARRRRARDGVRGRRAARPGVRGATCGAKFPELGETPTILTPPPRQITAFDPASGFDDFLVMPCVPAELYARIRALEWSRSEFATEERLKIGSLVVDRAAHEVSVDGRRVTLTAKEFLLLGFWRRIGVASSPARRCSLGCGKPIRGRCANRRHPRPQAEGKAWGCAAARDAARRGLQASCPERYRQVSMTVARAMVTMGCPCGSAQRSAWWPR